MPELEDDNPVDSHDSSTNGLINTFKEILQNNILELRFDRLTPPKS